MDFEKACAKQVRGGPSCLRRHTEAPTYVRTAMSRAWLLLWPSCLIWPSGAASSSFRPAQRPRTAAR